LANLLAQRIQETLRPIIGSVLASVSVELESKRLGRTTDTITRADLDTLADNLSQQLSLVVGKDLAEAAAKRVRELA
jgi:hypothetical protein